MAGGGWLIEVVIAGSRAQLMHVMIKPITEGGSSSVGAGAGSGGGDHGGDWWLFSWGGSRWPLPPLYLASFLRTASQ